MGLPRFNSEIWITVQLFYYGKGEECAANAILRIEGRSNDLTMLQLLESHCVPILTYGIEVVHFINRDERRQLRVAYNSIIRKLFGYRWSESVTALQAFLNRHKKAPPYVCASQNCE
jgi:hypothetical protein